jgi:prepilin-type N-terminal cleavage/methylation domain-containing protein
MKRNGFTLIELLVVIAIIAILATLGSKSLRSARLSARKAQAMVEMKSIETAIKSYINTYGKLPVSAEEQGAPDPEPDEDSSRNVIQILTAENTVDNPRELVFLEPQSTSVGGDFRDPWGAQYLIVLDTDYNGEIAYGGEIIRRKVGVVSVGLQLLRASSSTNDLIKSWQ